ncbi:hypothetical protein [Helicobacter pylori]|uniref:hypothetical protein n=1 Tax=Helicobacter pylori TaxID=210 RepID=UPI00057420DD|nr:hypothetical protein [Helicobacter pylori]KHL78182.1 hypothetical protein HPY1152_04530 [Helicobacter pylori]
MEAKKKQLRDNVLKSLIMLYIHEHDELKGYEVIEHKTQDNNGNLIKSGAMVSMGLRTIMWLKKRRSF